MRITKPKVRKTNALKMGEIAPLVVVGIVVGPVVGVRQVGSIWSLKHSARISSKNRVTFSD